MAYLQAVASGEGGWDIVSRGYGTGREQILGRQTTPPWFSAWIAASATRIAFVTDDSRVRLFEWRSQ
ncbi:MAG: hypothetical protein M5U22_04775 [Thermoleophilia bacterium]|nr:hypothetical protein [Thermoleophilia bacterium]